MAISLWNSWKIGSWHPMWYTLGENCKGTIYNLIYGTCFKTKSCIAVEKWKINLLFVVLWVYYFSHKPLHIGCLHAKGFQFLSIFIIFFNFFRCVVKIAWMSNHIEWLGNWVFFVDTAYTPDVEGENDFSEFIGRN